MQRVFAVGLPGVSTVIALEVLAVWLAAGFVAACVFGRMAR